MNDKITINAMMEDDMFAWMYKNGYWDDLIARKITCDCGEVITEENLTALKKIDGKMHFYHSIICTS